MERDDLVVVAAVDESAKVAPTETGEVNEELREY